MSGEMTRSRIALALVLAVWCASAAHPALATTVRATLDRERVHVGEQIVLGIEVSGVRSVEAPRLDSVPGFTAQYLGPSTQVSIAGGQVLQSVTHRYALVAMQPGTRTLGPFSVPIEGTTYQTEPVQVEVLAQRGAAQGAPAQVPDGPDLELRLDVPSTDVYLHQRVPISLTLYIGSTRVDDVRYPQLPGDAFAIELFGEASQRRVRRGGRISRAVTFDTSIIPLRSGELTLGPAVQSMAVLANTRDPVFGRFFGSDLFAERRPHEVRSNVVSLNVRPLPQDGRPADFSGAVGRFDFDVSAQPTQLEIGDPITLTMRISGKGNLTALTAPSVDAPGFKSYPAHNLKAEEGTATRVIEQVIIPTQDDVTEVPEIRFSYFDPEAGAYRVVSRGPLPLVLRSRQRAAEPPMATAPAAAPGAHARAEELGRDIVYVKDTPGRLRRAEPPYLRPWFLIAQVFPLGVYLIALSVARRHERLRGDPGYARFTRAARTARKAIAAVRRGASHGPAQAVYDGLAAAIREYLSAKLDLPVGAVDAERVAARLGATDLPVVGQVAEFLSLVERMRYAPGADGTQDRRAIALAEQIVRALERQGGLAERFDARRQAAGLALLLVVGVAARGIADPEVGRDPMTTFFESNAAYKAGDYATAAAGYQALVTAGFRSGPLHYNLGNALFKQGAIGRAILNYERARRVSPRDPDVTANLQLARERLGADAATAPLDEPWWVRLLVPLAPRANATELVVAASVAYTVTMLLLAARLFLPGARKLCGRAAMITSVLLIVAASAAGVRLVNEHARAAAVVVRPGDVPVRFEPSETGTVHFTLSEGAVVRELARRDGWCQVARGDGRRGWIEAGAVETL
jgi:tetratricopeptide (TPR) repeat protein